MMVGEVLRMSFEAAFAPLEEGETRLGNFREAFVNQLKMMAAQLLATAAAAAILATILTIAFGGSNLGRYKQCLAKLEWALVICLVACSPRRWWLWI